MGGATSADVRAIIELAQTTVQRELGYDRCRSWSARWMLLANHAETACLARLECAMDFFFRKPVFPIVVDTGTELIVLRTAAEGDRLLAAAVNAAGTGPLPVIDAKVEGFSYVPEHHTVSPLAIKKAWTKAEIIALYNDRKPAGAPPYAPTLATRKLAQVFADVVNLLRPSRSASPRRG